MNLVRDANSSVKLEQFLSSFSDMKFVELTKNYAFLPVPTLIMTS